MKTGTERKRADLSLLFLVLLLLVLGLVLLYSTSAYNGRVKFQDPAYYFKKQLFATTLGLLALYLVSQMDYHRIARLAWPIYGCSLLLSTLVLFVGREYNGSKRWLALGPLSFQPAEFAKVAVVIFLARQIRIRNRIIIIPAPTSPSSSQIMEKIISFWASGTNPSFCRLLPSPLPKMPPLPMAYSPWMV